MRAETIPRFVVVGSGRVIVKYPSGMLRPAGLVNDAADLFVRSVPEPAHATMVAMRLPELRVDVTFGIERGDELVAVPGRSGRKFLRPCEVELDALEGMGQCHEGVLHQRLRWFRCSLLAAATGRFLDLPQARGLEHILDGEPVPTLPGHALGPRQRRIVLDDPLKLFAGHLTGEEVHGGMDALATAEGGELPDQIIPVLARQVGNGAVVPDAVKSVAWR